MKIVRFENGVIDFDIWKKEAKKEARALAKGLGLAKTEFKIRVLDTQCGIELPEITLQAPWFYLVFRSALDTNDRDYAIVYRTCKGPSDFCGGHNHWMYSSAYSQERLLEWCEKTRPSAIA